MWCALHVKGTVLSACSKAEGALQGGGWIAAVAGRAQTTNLLAMAVITNISVPATAPVMEKAYGMGRMALQSQGGGSAQGAHEGRWSPQRLQLRRRQGAVFAMLHIPPCL